MSVVHTSIDELTDDTREALETLLAELRRRGLNPRVLETFRTQERQDALYEQSQRNIEHGLPPKTNTRRSWHYVRRGADVEISPATTENILAFLDSARSLGFTTTPDPDRVREAIARGASSAEINHLLWDHNHVSYRNGRSYAEARREALALRGETAGASLNDFLQIGLLIGAIAIAIREAHKHSR